PASASAVEAFGARSGALPPPREAGLTPASAHEGGFVRSEARRIRVEAFGARSGAFPPPREAGLTPASAHEGGFVRSEARRIRVEAQPTFFSAQSGKGFSATPFHHCFSGPSLKIVKWRCGVSGGALPVVPTYPITSPFLTPSPSLSPSAYRSRCA